MDIEEIKELLKQQAKEIAAEGNAGWGNTMITAMDMFADLQQQLENLKCEYKECHTFHQIQSLSVSWSYKNFGNHYGTGYRNLLGIVEEVGELSHAQLKGEQGIRHTPEEILQMKKDAIGDIIIFLCNYCDSQKLSLHECVNLAWNEIKDRNWQTGKEQ